MATSKRIIVTFECRQNKGNGMKAICKCIYCPKHPKCGTGLEYNHDWPARELEADVDCFQPDDEEFYEMARDRLLYDLDKPNIVYADRSAYCEELGDIHMACINEEYQKLE